MTASRLRTLLDGPDEDIRDVAAALARVAQ
jgi:hypothetical protein